MLVNRQSFLGALIKLDKPLSRFQRAGALFMSICCFLAALGTAFIASGQHVQLSSATGLLVLVVYSFLVGLFIWIGVKSEDRGQRDLESPLSALTRLFVQWRYFNS